MDLNEIPQDQTDKFPAGVSEHEFHTEKEVLAFLSGLNLADAIDVEHGEPFVRQTPLYQMHVVRVRVGNFEEDEDEIVEE